MDRRFRYLGKYQVTRVDPLSVDEWAMFSAEVSAANDLRKFCNLTFFFFFFLSSNLYTLNLRRIKLKMLGPWKIFSLLMITAIFVFRVYRYSVSVLMTTSFQLF